MPHLAMSSLRLPPAILSLFLFAGCGSSPQAYVDRGNQYFQKAKYDDAEIQYQKAIQKSPKLGEAYYRLALVHLQKKQVMQGYRELRKAAELMPGDVPVLAKLGQLSLSLYNLDPKHPHQLYDQADSAAAQLAAKDPNGFEANLLQGALEFAGKKPAEAVAHLRKAVKTKPEDPDATLGLAQALVQNNQTAEGLEVAEGLIRREKAFGAAYGFLFDEYRSLSRPDEAENILKLRIANNPKQAEPLLQLARYFNAERKQTAVEATIQRLLDHPSDFPDRFLVAGDFYSRIGQPEKAFQLYQKGVSSPAKEKIPFRKRIMGILMAQKKWPEALAQVDAILKEQPEEQETRLARVMIWLGEGRPENIDPAVAELRIQQVKRPQDGEVHLLMGNALAAKKDLDGARREWSAAARQSATSLPPRYSLVQLDLAQNKAPEALQVALEILAIQPDDPQVRLLVAACLTGAGQYQRARVELSKLSIQFPQSPQVKFRLGMLDLYERKYREAENVFSHLGSSAGYDPEILAGLAQAYQGQNESSKALQLLQDEVKRKPDSLAARRILAQFAMASKNYDVAIQQLKALAAADPKSTDVALTLASAQAAKGNFSEAISDLKTALALDPKSTAARFQLAQTLYTNGQLNEAKAAYRQVLTVQPNHANALNDLAYLMADSGDNLDEALSLAQRGLQSSPAAGLRTSLSDTLGWIYLKKNMNDNAVQTFQSLVRNNPGSMTYRYHLGAALYQKGDQQRARTELQAALSSKPMTRDEPKIRELLARL